MRVPVSFLCVLGLIVGCGAAPTPDAGSDAGAMSEAPAQDTPAQPDTGATDTPAVATDHGPDAPTSDATPDALALDAPTEAAVDAPAEDAPEVATTDGSTDAGPTAELAPIDTGEDTDAGFDAGADAGFDVGFDAGTDAGFDVGFDVAFDAGPPADVPLPPCPAGETRCGGLCVATTTDPLHCGACGAACPAGRPCVGGACACAVGQTACGGACVNTRTDPGHCNGCGLLCGSGQSCAAGRCVCPVGQSLCGGGCVDPATSVTHCGGCDRGCATGQGCVDGACRCPSGQTLCGGACVTTATDRAHCGGCGRACPTAQACVGGACACPTGQVLCGDACVDTTISVAHCGVCDRACPTGQLCNGGLCGLTCGAPRIVCGAGPQMTCVDPQATEAHCGGCDRACPTGQSCVSGTCACPSGQTLCGGACVTTATSNTHCGACNRACPSAQTCVAGSCVCPSGQTLCGGVCVTTATSNTHCGACDRACPTAQTCVASTCACPSGLTFCDNTCLDTQTTLAHCGGCNRVCPTPANATATCAGATCGFTCNPGFALLGGVCATVAAPRPIAPLSTATVTSRRPTLRWELRPGSEGALVDLCRDRACTMAIATLTVTGSSAAPMTDLPPGAVFWRLRPRVAGVTGSAMSPTWQMHVGVLSAGRDTSWGSVPDVNGDGIADLLLGNREANSNAGSVYVLMGRATVGVATTPTLTLAPPDSGANKFGSAVASAGDVNGDGFADVIVGASSTGDPTMTGTANTGRAFVYYGGPSGLATTPATRIDSPTPSNSEFGASAAGVGDVNGDGYADVIIGAPGRHPTTHISGTVGQALVYLGGPGGLSPVHDRYLVCPEPFATRFAEAIAGAGDLNGDGYGDIALGGTGINNVRYRVFVYHGGPSGIPATPTLIFARPGNTVEQGNDDSGFGMSVAGAGDFNGDGFADLVVGAPRVSRVSNDAIGEAYLFYGSVTGLNTAAGSASTLYGLGTRTNFGTQVRGVGDFNHDGRADVLVAEFGLRPTSTGRTHLFLGRATFASSYGASNYLHAPSGYEPGDCTLIGGPGDLNGDGFADTVSAYFRSVVVHHGNGSAPTTPTVVRPTTLVSNAVPGFSVASAQ